MGATATQQWYKVKEDVEYSTDFNFFLTNQIFVSVDGTKYSFNSRLQSQTFSIKRATYSDVNVTTERVKQEDTKKFINVETINRYAFSQSKIESICKEIHEAILVGKYGEGVLTD